MVTQEPTNGIGAALIYHFGGGLGKPQPLPMRDELSCPMSRVFWGLAEEIWNLDVSPQLRGSVLGCALGRWEERASRESSSIQALASTTSLRMTAVIATWCGLPESTSRW